MAGIPKRKLDYASWSTDIFDNESSPIYDLLDKFKSDGFLIYFYLCQRAYGTDGYFYKWSFENASRTAIKTGSSINGETVKKAVEHCLEIGAFDKQLFEKYGILTNKEIQKIICLQ